MNTRIPLLSKEEAIEKGKALGINEYIAGMNIFRTLLNHPVLAKEFNSTIITLVNSGVNEGEGGEKLISDRLREIIIMRVAWLAMCDYEWSQHWLASLFFGLSEQELESIQDWQNASQFNEMEKNVLEATDALINYKRISSGLWEKLIPFFPTDQAKIELVSCIGNWHMFALILNGLEVPLDEGMLSWAPKGNGPIGN